MWVDASQWDTLRKGANVYRGAKWNITEQVISVASPTDRSPVNMPLDAHRQIDDYFEQRFGVRFRSRSLFVTGDQASAETYGQVRCLAPTADFCFCWSPFAFDLFEEVLNMGDEESYEDLLNRLSYRCDDLHSAIDSGHEIMLVGSAFNAVVAP